MSENLLWPVFEFRPERTRWRYDDGNWSEDDGETYDLAFAWSPFCLYVDLPYRPNILWSWLSRPWTSDDSNHPDGNPWHYMLREGETEFGASWGRDRHLNSLAGRDGMRMVSSKYGAANGRHVEFQLGDPFIAAGLVRERDTGRVLKFPDAPPCMYCGSAWQEDGGVWRPEGESTVIIPVGR